MLSSDLVSRCGMLLGGERWSDWVMTVNGSFVTMARMSIEKPWKLKWKFWNKLVSSEIIVVSLWTRLSLFVTHRKLLDSFDRPESFLISLVLVEIAITRWFQFVRSYPSHFHPYLLDIQVYPFFSATPNQWTAVSYQIYDLFYTSIFFKGG